MDNSKAITNASAGPKGREPSAHASVAAQDGGAGAGAPESKKDGGNEQKRQPLAADEDDEDIPIAQLLKKPKKEPKAPAQPKRQKVVVEDDEDDDEDVPIAQLIKSQAPVKTEKETKAAKKRPRAEANSDPQPKKIKAEPEATSSNAAPVSKSKPATSSSDVKDKNDLVMKLLCRWWYAFSWPTDDEISPCPPNFEPLDGFKGVYVCLKNENLGQVVDTRDKTNCPSYENLSQKPASELQELVVRAYEAQIRDLIEHEGPETELERSLKQELSDVKRISTNKMDNPKQASRKAKK